MATANLDLTQTTANVISGQASFLDVTSAAQNYSIQDYISAGLDAASFVDALSGMAHPPGVSPVDVISLGNELYKANRNYSANINEKIS